MSPKIAPNTQGNWLVTLKGFDFYFTDFSGFEDAAQITNYNDGLSNRNQKLLGPRELAEMTLMVPFDPVVHAPLVDWWKTYCGGETKGETVSVQAVKYCPEPEPVGKTFLLYNVRPTKLSGIDVNKTSQEVNKLSIGIIADTWDFS